jgi:transglutaminase-like putative cysteine protease
MWRRFRVWFCCWVALLLIASAGVVRATPPDALRVEIGPVPDWVLPAVEVEQRQPESNGGVATLRLDLQTRRTGGQRWHFVRVAYQITAEVGIRELGQQKFNFVPPHEKLVFHSLEVTREGEVRSELKPGFAEVLQREASLESQIYSGARTALVVLPDLRVGDVLAVEYSVVGANPVLAGHAMDWWRLGLPYPVAELRYRTLSDRRLEVRAHDGVASPTVSERGPLIEYSWQAKSLPATQLEERLPSDFSPWPSLQFTDFGSWSEVVAWGRRLFEPPAPTPRVKQVTAAIESAAQTPEQRVLLALRKVQDEIRYFSVMLGEGSHRPAAPDTVLKQRFGDCKDKSVLLVALLRSLGFEADVALVSLRNGRRLPELLPASDAFNHAIVAVVVEGTRYFLDPTALHQRGSLDQVAARDFHHALLLSAGQQSLLVVPQPSQGLPELEADLRVKFERYGGPTSLEIIATLRGGYAEYMRGLKASSSTQDFSRAASDPVLKTYPRARLLGDPIFDDWEQDNRVVLTMHFALDDAWSSEGTAGPSLYLFPPWLRGRVVTIDSQRRYPVALEYPLRLLQRFEITVPAGLTLPSSSSTVAPGLFTLKSTISNSGNTVKLSYDFEANADRVLPQGFSAYRDAVAQLEKELGLTLRGPGPAVSGARPPITLWVLAVVWTLALLAIVFFVQRKKPYWPRPDVAWDPKLTGIGGWLIVLGIGVTLSPVRQVIAMMSTSAAFLTERWGALLATDPGYEAVLIFELCMNLFCLVGMLYCTFLFWTKSRTFPIGWIVVTVSSMTLMLADAFFASRLVGYQGGPKEMGNLGGSVLGVLVWTTYLAQSKRVRATFLPPPAGKRKKRKSAAARSGVRETAEDDSSPGEADRESSNSAA